VRAAQPFVRSSVQLVTQLAQVVEALEQLYPSSLAEPWDAVGLVCGDPAAAVHKVLFAVDPVEVVAQEAVDLGCQLLVTHHPLYLGGTTSVAADDPKGRVVHRLISSGCGLLVAHTNADRAEGGVNDALAGVFQLRDCAPLVPATEEVDRLVAFVPPAHADQVRDAVFAAGAGAIGSYDRCSWSTAGTGQFRPLPGAQPAVGEVGATEQVEEVRLETVVPRQLRAQVLAALRAAHPYETPAFDVIELAALPSRAGLGRVGDLPEPMTLAALTDRVAEVLPPTAWGVRSAGDPQAQVRRLAVCGGAGDDLMGAARAAGADAFLTSDLRHHRSSERPAGLALLDAAHWATEWPWLAVAAEALARVVNVETVVSTTCTDPWTTSSRSPRT
jgi:dinuclear metal center YbgI/SA1388 family protein